MCAGLPAAQPGCSPSRAASAGLRLQNVRVNYMRIVAQENATFCRYRVSIPYQLLKQGKWMQSQQITQQQVCSLAQQQEVFWHQTEQVQGLVREQNRGEILQTWNAELHQQRYRLKVCNRLPTITKQKNIYI